MTDYTAQDLRRLHSEGKFTGRTVEFVESLLKADAGYGLSEKQAFWVNKLCREVLEPKPAAAPLPNVGDVSQLLAMFAKAKESGLKAPRVRLEGFVLTLAKEGSANFGSIYVKDANGTYCGKVNPQGEYRQAYGIGSLADQASAAVLAFASNPLVQAAAYGKLTGSCCFCGLTLTDNNSRELGYGPICAARYGMGHTPARKSTTIKVDRNLKTTKVVA